MRYYFNEKQSMYHTLKSKEYKYNVHLHEFIEL